MFVFPVIFFSPLFACFPSRWGEKEVRRGRQRSFSINQELYWEGMESNVGDGGQLGALWIAAPGASPLLGLQARVSRGVHHGAFNTLLSWDPSSRALRPSFRFGRLHPWPRKKVDCGQKSSPCLQTPPGCWLTDFLPEIWSMGPTVRKSRRQSGNLGHWFVILSQNTCDTGVVTFWKKSLYLSKRHIEILMDRVETCFTVMQCWGECGWDKMGRVLIIAADTGHGAWGVPYTNLSIFEYA